ncbi:Rieske (2Fe-2S) iron-sulfur domain protein [Sphingobium chlorophenolicum]|uniref:Rieske (2Fe-2S) iron-sulfur domain protein n=2 Tax=Sphingobium chlorophenolicum TaxID=46429 RepID=A0A081RA07_SPHCR|nr:Rieske (2Fe-2S) iron-sulfur domain protein [Sphingobium chlorophenolicum]
MRGQAEILPLEGNEQPASFAARGGMDNGPVPLESYRSPELFALERERVFRRAWLFMGRVERVAKPGDFLVREVEICNASILIIRGKDGQVRAFHNVCPHRANLVETRREGNAPALVCRYHGWSFNNDGSLRGVPDQEMFLELDKSKCGLPPVALEIWNGWIFINLAEKPEVSLDEFLGSFKDYYDGVEAINLDCSVVIETRLKCNWKVVADAFVEAYHIPSIHRTTIKSMFSNRENPFGRLLDAQFFGPHRTISMFGNAEDTPREDQPIVALARDPSIYRPEVLEASARYMSHPAVNPTKQPGWSMDASTIFPNLNLDAGFNGQFTHEYWPVSVNECLHRATYYFPKPTNIRERFQLEYMMAWFVDVIYEDLGNVERTQRGIDSGATKGMQLSESEVSIRHSVQQIEKWLRAETVADALQ